MRFHVARSRFELVVKLNRTTIGGNFSEMRRQYVINHEPDRYLIWTRTTTFMRRLENTTHTHRSTYKTLHHIQAFLCLFPPASTNATKFLITSKLWSFFCFLFTFFHFFNHFNFRLLLSFNWSYTKERATSALGEKRYRPENVKRHAPHSIRIVSFTFISWAPLKFTIKTWQTNHFSFHCCWAIVFCSGPLFDSRPTILADSFTGWKLYTFIGILWYYMHTYTIHMYIIIIICTFHCFCWWLLSLLLFWLFRHFFRLGYIL